MSRLTIVSKDSLLQERRSGERVERVPYMIGGEVRFIEKRITNGEMGLAEFDRPVGELMTSAAGIEAVTQKTVLDIEVGREQVPVLYQPIYRRRENANFTKWVEVGTPNSRYTGIFLEHLEGEEVKFGERTFEGVDTVPIITYAQGAAWTEDMVEFDLTWEAEEVNRGIGESYNALLNHLHLDPILSYSYAAKNLTPAASGGASLYEDDRATIKAALEEAALDKNAETGTGRNPTIILAHPSNRFRIEEALQGAQIGGTIFPAIGQQLSTIILYDGWSGTVGQKTYEYAGVPTTHIFLIDPQRYFHELVKHDLRVSAGTPDLSRLITDLIVARFRRGVWAVPANGVQKVELPT